MSERSSSESKKLNVSPWLYGIFKLSGNTKGILGFTDLHGHRFPNFYGILEYPQLEDYVLRSLSGEGRVSYL